MLLQTGLIDTEKLSVINEMETSYVVTKASVASDIGSVLNRAGVGHFDDEALETLSELPSPRSDIALRGKSPGLRTATSIRSSPGGLTSGVSFRRSRRFSSAVEIKINTLKKN